MIGIINGIQERISSKGNKFAFLQLSDPSGIFEVLIFSDLLDLKSDILSKGNIIVIDCLVSNENGKLRLVVRNLNIFNHQDQNLSNNLLIKVDSNFEVKELAEILENNNKNKNNKCYFIKLTSIQSEKNFKINLPNKFFLYS